MFDPKEIEAYRNISAPEGLREKILSCDTAVVQKRNRAVFLKQISTIAACFVLVAVLTVFAARDLGDFSVSIASGEIPQGRTVAYEPDSSAEQALSVTRDPEETIISLTLDGNAELSVSDGTLHVVDSETNEILYTGTAYSARGETLVYWTVRADETADCFEMTVKGAFKTETIILSYSESDGEWTLTRTKN